MTWEPDRYLKFKQQRFEPFNDLLKLINIRSGLSVIDLGCGTGELTVKLADYLPDSHIFGIDNSGEMLDKTAEKEQSNVHFELSSIEAVSGKWDLILSNAAIHWVEDHESLIPRLFSMLNDDGQLVIQTPSNHRNPAQQTIQKLAGEEPFRTALDGWTYNFPVLPINRYAEILHAQGASNITVFDKVYPHILEDAEAILQWISGTTMVPYLEKLTPKLQDQLKVECLIRLKKIYTSSPAFFPFSRTLFAAAKN